MNDKVVIALRVVQYWHILSLFLIFCYCFTRLKLQNMRNLENKSPIKSQIFCQQTFQRCFNVVFRLIWRCDVAQRQINVETTLWMSKLKFTTLNNVESTLPILTLIWTTLGNVKTTLWIWPFEKNEKQNNIFELQRTQNLLHLIPHFKRNMQKNICWTAKILKTSNILN